MNIQTVVADRWSISGIARVFSMDRRTVVDKIQAANIQPIGTNKGYPVYSLADVAKAIFASEVLIAGSAGFDPDKLPPRERRDWYEGEEKRIKIEKLRASLVSIDTYRAELADVLKAVSLTLETLPDVLERKCGLSPDAAETMGSVLDDARTQLADKICSQCQPTTDDLQDAE